MLVLYPRIYGEYCRRILWFGLGPAEPMPKIPAPRPGENTKFSLDLRLVDQVLSGKEVYIRMCIYWSVATGGWALLLEMCCNMARVPAMALHKQLECGPELPI